MAFEWLYSYSSKKQGKRKMKSSMCSICLITSGWRKASRHLYGERRSEVKSLSLVWLFATPWTVAYKAPLSMEFSRQEYWSGLPFPSPGDHPDPGIEPGFPTLQADTLPSEPPGQPQGKVCHTWRKERGCRWGYVAPSSGWAGRPIFQLLCQHTRPFQCLLFFALSFSCSVVSDSLRHH